jgi:ribosomal protein S24E
MDLEIVSKKSNPLLSREEIVFRIKNFTSTPSRKDIRAKIAALTNSKEELVIVGKINQEYGLNLVEGESRVYKNAEQMKKVELPFFLERNFGEKKKKEEKPAEKEPEKGKEEKNKAGETPNQEKKE